MLYLSVFDKVYLNHINKVLDFWNVADLLILILLSLMPPKIAYCCLRYVLTWLASMGVAKSHLIQVVKNISADKLLVFCFLLFILHFFWDNEFSFVVFIFHELIGWVHKWLGCSLMGIHHSTIRKVFRRSYPLQTG